MDDHSDDIRRPLSPRIEVYAGAGRKRWPDDLKAQIAAESLEPGAIVTDVARRHGCRPQQVHDWRRRARLGQLVLPASADTLSFVPVVFRAKRADRVKIVVWDGSGLVLYWKRLDGSGFKWPPIVAGVMRMNAAQLSALLAGMDWTRMHAPRIPQPKALA
jgi:transposase